MPTSDVASQSLWSRRVHNSRTRVIQGSSTPASDPLDTAVVAYLRRRMGERVVTPAGEQWRPRRGDPDGDVIRGQIAELREQIARLQAQAHSENTRIRAAVAKSRRREKRNSRVRNH